MEGMSRVPSAHPLSCPGVQSTGRLKREKGSILLSIIPARAQEKNSSKYNIAANTLMQTGGLFVLFANPLKLFYKMLYNSKEFSECYLTQCHFLRSQGQGPTAVETRFLVQPR